jgi:hypothetical protein
MKNLNLIAAAAFALGTAPAYAGDMDVLAGPSGNAVTVSQANPSSAQPVTPMKGNAASHDKTRQEVRQELIRAQQDGTIARLNALFYGGGSQRQIAARGKFPVCSTRDGGLFDGRLHRTILHHSACTL